MLRLHAVRLSLCYSLADLRLLFGVFFNISMTLQGHRSAEEQEDNAGCIPAPWTPMSASVSCMSATLAARPSSNLLTVTFTSQCFVKWSTISGSLSSERRSSGRVAMTTRGRLCEAPVSCGALGQNSSFSACRAPGGLPVQHRQCAVHTPTDGTCHRTLEAAVVTQPVTGKAIYKHICQDVISVLLRAVPISDWHEASSLCCSWLHVQRHEQPVSCSQNATQHSRPPASAHSLSA